MRARIVFFVVTSLVGTALGCSDEPAGSSRNTELAAACLAVTDASACRAVAEGQRQTCVSFDSPVCSPAAEGGSDCTTKTVCMLLCDVTVADLACPEGSSCKDLGQGKQTGNLQTGCVPD